MPFWHHFGCILADSWEVLGIFWSPFAIDVGNSGSHLGHLLATIDSHVASSDPTHWISLRVIRATSGKSTDGEELITWIAGWMDFWCWRYLRSAGPGESWPAWPSTIFPTLFDMDFPGHFDMDLASILKQFWNICISFWRLKLHHRFLTFFLRFSMQKWYPSTLENSIITWYSRKKQRNLTFRFYMYFI